MTKRRLPEVGQTGSHMWLAQFEFRTGLENHYWLPLAIRASTPADAQEIADRISEEILKHYTIVLATPVMLYHEGISSEFIDDLVGRRAVVSIDYLEWRLFRLAGRDPERIDFGVSKPKIERHGSEVRITVASSVESKQLPVYLIDRRSIPSSGDCLLLHVEDPRFPFVELVVQVSEPSSKVLSEAVDTSQHLDLLEEGKWVQSKHNDYLFRVERSPDTGMLHVHIAHRKHVNVKTKQVSWNLDLTRHDRKSFDSNFIGLKRAKELARAALGLPSDALLEQRTDDEIGVLVEGTLGRPIKWPRCVLRLSGG